MGTQPKLTSGGITLASPVPLTNGEHGVRAKPGPKSAASKSAAADVTEGGHGIVFGLTTKGKGIRLVELTFACSKSAKNATTDIYVYTGELLPCGAQVCSSV